MERKAGLIIPPVAGEGIKTKHTLSHVHSMETDLKNDCGFIKQPGME